jgi:hydrogenase nickel incorporation protein HypB
MKVTVVKDILDANRRIALQNRQVFDRHGLMVLNLMSSPGAGKTTLLERTIRDLAGEISIGVIEGDIQTSLDSERIERAGATFAHQINTFGACHIDGNMISPVLDQVDLASIDLLVVENVGNLVCPAEFEVGEDHKLVLFSVTEGEDKPHKYPLMFRESVLMLVNKIDLLPHLNVELESIHDAARQVHPEITILDISSQTGEGMNGFYDWLREEVKKKKERGPAGES